MSPTFKRFLKYARPYTVLIVSAIAIGLAKFSLALALPLSLGYVIDHVLPEIAETGRLTRLWYVLVALTVAFLLRGGATYYRSYWAAVAGNRTIFDIRRDTFRHVQRLSLAYHSSRRTGETTARLISDLNAASGIVTQGIVAIAIDLIFLHGVVVCLFLLNWRLAGVSLFTLPFYGIVFRSLNPRLRKAATEVQEEMEEMSGEVNEKLGGLPVVISHVREKTEELNFFHRQRAYYGKLLRRIRLKMILTSVAEFLQSFGPVLVIIYGGYRVASDPLFTVGQFVTFYGFLSHLYLPTRRLADYSALLQEKLAAMDRVFEVLDSEPDIADRPGATPLVAPKGHIEFEEVAFCYDPGQPVLDGVTLAIEPGQSVAFVGRSGAGKSTLVNLVPRFYDVVSGVVRVDGRDVRDISVRSLRENIGIVLQDSILFTGTIRENILYGRHNATESEMIAAAEMAHAHEFVRDMPDGYDTVLGERGVTLSGGQKQRLSIARAFLRDPRILILDEATSSLDSAAEHVIQDALRQLMEGRTTLVIAHRLSTVVDCDSVVVLEAGRVVQRGAHRDLIGTRGPYRRFCKEQFGGVGLEELSRRAG
ncbi:MAG: ABC transporter ATP-binding protein [Candidatus Hydrogenedentes bacterium]|nr:ABC transporter ATP-binding protein [Candidatus Hydrogenedentota bacterium]